AGDAEGAVEAETALSELHWTAGDRDRSFEHLARARHLADPLPASAAKARAVAFASRISMLAGEYREAVRLGEEALAMATDLGLDEIRSATLNNVGSSRSELEGEDGTSQIVEAIEVARRANAPFEICRGLGNVAGLY